MDDELEGWEEVLVAWMKSLGVWVGAGGMGEELQGRRSC